MKQIENIDKEIAIQHNAIDKVKKQIEKLEKQKAELEESASKLSIYKGKCF